MTQKITKLIIISFLVLPFVFSLGCGHTQKTAGQGMISAVAQNVVRIAGIKAMKAVDFSALDGKKANIEVTGFVDDFNRGFIENIVGNKAEDSKVKLVSSDKAEFIIEVAVNTAGNDQGIKKIPLISSSERSEGTVDLTITIRDAKSGDRLQSQKVVGIAKYEQGSILGITGSGQYYVQEGGEFVKVLDPSAYK